MSGLFLSAGQVVQAVERTAVTTTTGALVGRVLLHRLYQDWKRLTGREPKKQPPKFEPATYLLAQPTIIRMCPGCRAVGISRPAESCHIHFSHP